MHRGSTRASRAFSLVTSVLLSLQLLGVEAPRAFAESIVSEEPIEVRKDDATGGTPISDEAPAVPETIEGIHKDKGADGSKSADLSVAASMRVQGDDETGATEWTSTTTMPTEPGTYVLTDDVYLEEDWVPFSQDGQEITINMNGYFIVGNNNMGQIRVDKPHSMLNLNSGSIAYLAGDGGSLIIKGIVNLDNVNIDDCIGYGNCGAVTLTDGGQLYMHDGWIKHCKAERGGVYVSNTAYDNGVERRATQFFVSGMEKITDNTTWDPSTPCNVFIGDGAKSIVVNGPLHEGARIGVRQEGYYPGAVTNGWSDNNPDDDPADFFFSDLVNEQYDIVPYIGLGSDNEVRVLYHEHDWDLSVDSSDSSVAVVTCGNESCNFGQGAHTITLEASDVTYDGQKHGATVSYSDKDMPGVHDFGKTIPVTASVDGIKYYTGDVCMDDTPQYPGTYTAKLEVSLRDHISWEVLKTVTIERPFTISSVPLAITAAPAVGLVYNGEPQQLVSFSGEDWGHVASGVYYKVDDDPEYTHLTANPNPDDQGLSGTPPMATEAGMHTVSYYYHTSDEDRIKYDVGSAEEPHTLEVKIESADKPAFLKQNLVLTGQIGLTVFLSLPQLEGIDWTGSYVTFDVSGRGARSVDVAFDPNHKDTEGKLYGFTVPLSSVEMAQLVTATLHYTQDGQERELAADNPISVKNYVEGFDKVAAAYDDKTVALVHAVADYGHWVQPFLSAMNGWAIGDDSGQYASMDKFYVPSWDRNATKEALASYGMSKNIAGSQVQKVSADLELGSETALDVILTVTDGVTPTVSSAMVGDRSVSVTPVSLGAATNGGVRWRVRVEGIRGWELREQVQLEGDAQGAFSVSVSSLAYAGALLGNDSYAAGGGHDAICALVAYGDAQVAYRS